MELTEIHKEAFFYMTYQDTLRKNIRRSQLRSVALYAILALITASGAYSFFADGQTIRLMDLIPVPPMVSGGIFLVITAFLLALIAQTLRSALHNKVYRELEDNIKKFGNPDAVFAHVEKLPKSELCTRGDFRCDKKYVSFLQGDLVLLQPSRQIVWGYLRDDVPKAPSRRGLLPAAQPKATNEVVLRLTGRQTLKLTAKNEDAARRLLASVQECCPTMTSGYSIKYESVYAKNPENLRRSSAKKESEPSA